MYYIIYLTKSAKSARVDSILSVFILPTSDLKTAESDFVATLDVSTPITSFKSAFVAY